MGTYSKILKTLSIIAILFAIASFAAAIIVVSVGAYTLQYGGDGLDILMNNFLSKLSEEDTNNTAIVVIIVFSLTLAITGAFHLLIGLLGLRGSKKPNKLRFFIKFLAVFVILDIGSSIADLGSMAGANASTVGIELLKLTPTLLEAMMLFSAIKLRRVAKEEGGESFKEPDKLGFIRVMQIFFLFEMVIGLSMTMLIAPRDYTFEATTYITFINMILDGIAFWLIFKRFDFARKWIIGTCLLNIFAATILIIANNDISWSERIVNIGVDVIVLLYFALARRPKEILNREISLHSAKEEITYAWELWKPKTWDFWRSMIIYYCLFSIIGHWLEAGYCTLIRFGIMPGTYDPASGIWSDYLTPFPVYGAGMIACGLLLYPVKTYLQEKFADAKYAAFKAYALSFLFNMAVVAALELILGFTSNMPDENGVYPLWDYSDMPFNFMGQICLFNTMMFAACASIMSWVVWPALQSIYIKLPNDVKKMLFIGISIFYCIVVGLYVVNIS